MNYSINCTQKSADSPSLEGEIMSHDAPTKLFSPLKPSRRDKKFRDIPHNTNIKPRMRF